jgi:hypothetical protein
MNGDKNVKFKRLLVLCATLLWTVLNDKDWFCVLMVKKAVGLVVVLYRRCGYYVNCNTTFNCSSVTLCGDVQSNPGPDSQPSRYQLTVKHGDNPISQRTEDGLRCLNVTYFADFLKFFSHLMPSCQLYVTILQFLHTCRLLNRRRMRPRSCLVDYRNDQQQVAVQCCKVTDFQSPQLPGTE